MTIETLARHLYNKFQKEGIYEERRTFFSNKDYAIPCFEKSHAKKTLSKVTVSELVRDCQVNRNTFYYHFSDIYDLFKWTLDQEAVEVVRNINLIENTEEAMRFVLKYVDTNRHIINSAYDSMGHQEMKRFLYSDFIGIVRHTIDEGEKNLQVSVNSDFKDFMTMFYTIALVSILLDWLNLNDTSQEERLIQDALFILRTTIPQLLILKAE